MRNMIRSFVIGILLLVRTLVFGQAPPQVDISNGVLHARLYLPDTTTGYYRATRFDWSGVMPVLEYKGHNFITQWFPKYAPTIHDAIIGPVESFTPMDFAGDFVQIGVGALVRPDTARYNPFRYYPIRDAGVWKVTVSRREVGFSQRLDGHFVYTKKVVLVKGKPEMLLVHTLKNTGHRVMETDVFDHNFFRVDSGLTGPGSVLKFRFVLAAEQQRGPAEIRGDSIVILRQLTGKESVYGILHGYSDQADDYDIRLETAITGIRIRADRPISKLAYWASPTILCPEPYIHVRVDPGKTFSWTIHYEFYTK